MKPKLFESLQTQGRQFSEQRQAYEQLRQKVEHPFLKRYVQMGVKEGLFSDVVGALGRMHDTLVQSAWPELIGRNIITVRPTTETMERFPLDVGAVAYKYAEGAVTRLSGKKVSTVDIYTDQLAESSDEWTREYLEDATWNVMDNAIEKIGLALGQNETEKILALYAGIAAGDLASGAELAGGGAVLSWSGLLKLHHAVRSENWRPNILAVNEMQLHQLLNDDKFVHAQYLPSGQTDLEQGAVTSVLGMKVQPSTLVPNGTAYAIDTRVASVMLLRRDVTTEDWEDVKSGKYGVRATTRFGIGVLRSNAVARMTNIKTTLT
ncbi:MAG: phage major capsid protein [Candidatus Bathyarchaeota archaeon]|nr:phage major capsid protein [Candidatus Bathyarchaeota archaeon]